MIAVAWEWIDEKTVMVLGEDMHWYRLDNVYVKDIKFEGLDVVASEEQLVLTRAARWPLNPPEQPDH